MNLCPWHQISLVKTTRTFTFEFIDQNSLIDSFHHL